MIETSDGFRLNCHEWLAEQPLCTLVLVHGYGEHAGRYAQVAGILNARRISVVAADLRGHGLSSGERGHVAAFEDYHLDIRAMVDHAESLSRGGPIALLGHSMGGLLCVDWLLAGKGQSIFSLALSSPMIACESFTSFKMGLLRLSSLLRKSVGTGLSGAKVCRDQVLALQYDTDPLIFHRASCAWVFEVKRAMDRVAANAARLSLPSLILYAEEDEVVMPSATKSFAESLTVDDLEVEGIPEAYHEIFNEPVEARKALIGRVARWLTQRATRSAFAMRGGVRESKGVPTVHHWDQEEPPVR